MTLSVTENLPSEPPQPGSSSWRFVDDLKAPLWRNHNWKSKEAGPTEASLASGVRIQESFPDPDGVLETAYDDLRTFLAAGGVECEGIFVCETVLDSDEEAGAYRLEISAVGCRIVASDTEGIRPAIFHLERLMLIAGGPFLPLGTIHCKAAVKTRISRCFFGPIKRPPFNRDELADEENYYPDEYLNRLAHDGINALWLSISFKDLCRSKYFPSFGADAERRLKKLRQTVDRCARYGIRIFAFAIEPISFGESDVQIPLEELRRHPELGGHRHGSTQYFCVSSQKGQDYLEQSCRELFSQVPKLGGLINISFGERPTHCYCGSDFFGSNTCPRCSLRPPADVFSGMLGAMARGIHSVAPQAEMIAWLYTPRLRDTPDSGTAATKATLADIASKIPVGVTLQVNFESTGQEIQLGKPRPVLDYTLAHIGPSDLFEACARATAAVGRRMSAKLQVGCSHEVATVPFVPVPGNIYRKYKKMLQLGVSTAMQSWYFGNYPSIMTSAAGRCSMQPLPASEDEFLLELARQDWGEDAEVVVEAWKKFRDAYQHFPANLQFAHYSPTHDCLTWPLHLEPVDTPIAPSWKFDFPDISGDRIGECIGFTHTLDEILILCRKLVDGWDRGLDLLKGIAAAHHNDRARRQDIGVAEALALQFGSAWNVIQFYALREELPWQSSTANLRSLAEMRDLVEKEIAASRRLAELAEDDSRLGFHSEAEGYKYFPAKLYWRAECLESLLADTFPRIEADAAAGKALFQEYAGRQPKGRSYRCPKSQAASVAQLDWQSAPIESVGGDDLHFSWQALHSDTHLFLRSVCPDVQPSHPTADINDSFFNHDRVIFSIEPRRLWPCHKLHADAHGRHFQDDKGIRTDPRLTVATQQHSGFWETVLSVPIVCLRNPDTPGRPMHINVERVLPDGKSTAWIQPNPLPSRNHFGTDNPQDLGWLII